MTARTISSPSDRRDNRGDRFAGDVRVGQHFSDRQVALPMQYRARYRDSDAAYYRYDDDRIYQIDRGTGLIMAMFDIARLSPAGFCRVPSSVRKGVRLAGRPCLFAPAPLSAPHPDDG